MNQIDPNVLYNSNEHFQECVSIHPLLLYHRSPNVSESYSLKCPLSGAAVSPEM